MSTGDLKAVVDKIGILLTGHHIEFYVACETARQRLLHALNVPFFTELVRHVTPYTLRHILAQYQLLSFGVLP